MAPAMSTSVVDMSPLNSPPVLTSMTSSPSRVSMRSTPAKRAPTAAQARRARSSMSGVIGQGMDSAPRAAFVTQCLAVR